MEKEPLRFREHQANAVKLAEYLLNHDAISNVISPGLLKSAKKNGFRNI